MDYMKKRQLESGLHQAEEGGPDVLRKFEKEILHKELDKAAHQYQGLSHHRQEDVSILRSGFNVSFEHAVAAAKDELDELTSLEKEALDKLVEMEGQSQSRISQEKMGYYKNKDIDRIQRACEISLK